MDWTPTFYFFYKLFHLLFNEAESNKCALLLLLPSTVIHTEHTQNKKATTHKKHRLLLANFLHLFHTFGIYLFILLNTFL